MEDICRAAGIMNPSKGYGIAKVVEMLASEHLRGLSSEMKQAAVLMALNAAGITIGQVLQDYKQRRDALDAYEHAQKEQVEAEWAVRAEEVIQIHAELESVRTQFMARISRNLEGVTREKATFNAWLAVKQKETNSMSEAAELCSKSSVSEPVSAPLPDVRVAAASVKPAATEPASASTSETNLARAASPKSL
jgi:hypothetical protein